MRICAAAVPIAALLAAASAHAETAQERGEAQLARMLGDRIAGQQVECFHWTNATRPVVIDRVALVYDTGPILYVARPANAELLDPRDTIRVTRSSSQRLCTRDKFYVVTLEGGLITGRAEIEGFVPYTRPR